MSEIKAPRWLVPVLAALSAVLLAALWFGLRRLAAANDISPAVKISVIAVAAGCCLVLALAWLWPLLHQRRNTKRLGSSGILILVYILPVLALAIPLRLAAFFLPSADVRESTQNWLRLGPPWLLLIQGGLLTAALLPSGLRKLAPSGGKPLQWIPALLAGIGLWLLSSFTLNLIAHNAGFVAQPEPLPALGLFAAAVVSALVILPLGEEFFFRKVLPESILAIIPQPVLREYPILLWAISAAIFATLQARPLLWIPAFFLSLGLSALAQHTGRLRECILAHAVFNLLALVLNWATIL
jgi:membrane protease YdiL (CAAX protease family)